GRGVETERAGNRDGAGPREPRDQPCLMTVEPSPLASTTLRWARAALAKSAMGGSALLPTALPISMVPLNLPPSSRITVGATRLPRTVPVLLMMIFSLPTRSPFTWPSILMILAVTLALTRPDWPMVSSWLLRVMVPSTWPSMTRFSSLLISPLILTVIPIMAVVLTAEVVDGFALRSSWALPASGAGWGWWAVALSLASASLTREPFCRINMGVPIGLINQRQPYSPVASTATIQGTWTAVSGGGRRRRGRGRGRSPPHSRSAPR